MRRLSSRRKKNTTSRKNANKGIVASVLADHKVASKPAEENEIAMVIVEERGAIENSETEEREGIEKSNATFLGAPLPDSACWMSLYSESTKLYNEMSRRIHVLCPASAAAAAAENIADNSTASDDSEASDKQSNMEIPHVAGNSSETTVQQSNEEICIEAQNMVTTKDPDKDDDDDNSIAMEATKSIEDNDDDLAKSLTRLRGLTCVYDETKCNCGQTEAGETLNEVGRALAKIEVVKSLSRFLETENRPEANTPEELKMEETNMEETNIAVDEGIEVPLIHDPKETGNDGTEEEDHFESIEAPFITQNDPKEIENNDAGEEKEDIEVLAKNVPEQADAVSVQDKDVPEEANVVSAEEGQGKEGVAISWTSTMDESDLAKREMGQGDISSTNAVTVNGTEDQQDEQQQQQQQQQGNNNSIPFSGTSDDESLTEEEMLEKAIQLSLSKRSL